MAALWTIHSVHHQSEELNFSVALRQPWFSDVYAVLFYWPLPLLGIPPVPTFAAVALLSLNQVSLHTRVFSRPSFSVFNTPELHALHHATNPRYQDKNLGSALIVWDRLFGSYVTLDVHDPPRYGSCEGYRTHDAFAAQWLPVARLGKVAAAAFARHSGWAALRAGLWTCLGVPPSAEPAGSARPASAIPERVQRVALIQFFVAVALSTLLLWARDQLELGMKVALLVNACALFSFLGRKLDGVESGAWRVWTPFFVTGLLTFATS